MKRPLQVAYFTMVGLVPAAKNGGSICCRNHLERISADPDIDCTAYLAGPMESAESSLTYARAVAHQASYFSFSGEQFSVDNPPPGASYVSRNWPFMHELDGIGQKAVREQIAEEIRSTKPDVLVIDYFYSALFIDDLFSLGLPVVIITLNREGDFYEDMRLRKFGFYGRPANRTAEFRLRFFEQTTYRRCATVVSIGRNDLPQRGLGRARASWVSPFLEPSPDKWASKSANSLFFIGNHHHYPNRMAIEWLATKFCPELLKIAPDISVKVLGMQADEAPLDWQLPNIIYLGPGNDQIAAELFRSEGALIAPIANSFGAKFKVLEAISYGTPLLANKDAMSGVSFLPELPTIDLNNPKAAAVMAKNLLQDPGASQAMHQYLTGALDTYAKSQAGAWGRLLRGLVS